MMNPLDRYGHLPVHIRRFIEHLDEENIDILEKLVRLEDSVVAWLLGLRPDELQALRDLIAFGKDGIKDLKADLETRRERRAFWRIIRRTWLWLFAGFGVVVSLATGAPTVFNFIRGLFSWR